MGVGVLYLRHMKGRRKSNFLDFPGEPLDKAPLCQSLLSARLAVWHLRVILVLALTPKISVGGPGG